MEGGARLTAALFCGAGHSGSTLLGMILGSHSQAFYMGEGSKARYVGDPDKPLHKRACKLCGDACPVWGDFRWDQTRPLYRQVAERTGRRTIIDSTKNADWIAERLAENRSDARLCLFQLRRDGRAVMNSRLRKYPDHDPERLVRDWMAQMTRAQELYDGFDGPKMVVQYETLASAPEPVVRAACEVLGLAFEPAMLAYHAADHHPLGGNNGPQFIAARQRFGTADAAAVTLNPGNRTYYETHGAEIRLDLRWQRELAPDHAALFDKLAGSMNRTLTVLGE
jgi:hypothetical protein